MSSTSATIPVQTPKRTLNFRQLWNMSFGFLGIQFGFALQNANVSRIFQTLGAEIDDIGILWLAAPATGLLVQPIIGYLSDRTWHHYWGRRRLYFFIGSILASISLFIMPNSSALLMAGIMLWILDASINISMEPFRAFVGDLLPNRQQTQGFAMQTFFIGVGAVIASLLPYLFTNLFNISNTAPEGIVPDSVKYSFYIGGVVYFLSVMWTVFTTKEYPPENMQQWQEEKRRTKGVFKGFAEIVRGIGTMPKTMVQLAIVQFFTWAAFFSMWLYTTPAIAANAFGTSDPSTKGYQDAGDWVGVMFMVYNGVSALAAFLLPLLAAKIRRKNTHLICLILGGAGLLSIYFIQDQWILLVPMVLVGLAWASTLTMPYSILSGSLPAHKMGFYMGVFNFFVVIPQLIAASILGYLLRSVFNNQAVYALLIGGISMILAGLLNVIVTDHKEEEPKEIVEEFASVEQRPI